MEVVIGGTFDPVHNGHRALFERAFSRGSVTVGLTNDQEQTLTTAYERGYFAIPRGTTIQELGEALDISDSAVSQRLRRGEESLIAATLLTAADMSLSGHQE
jgi:cytidyltransferase-like protein